MPDGRTPGASGRSGIWPVTKTKPSVSTAWENGATGFGPPAIMWNFTPVNPFDVPRSRRVLKQLLAQDRVHAPVAVHDLRDAEINGSRHPRDRLLFGQALMTIRQ